MPPSSRRTSRATAAAPHSNASGTAAARPSTRQSRPTSDRRAATSKTSIPLARQSRHDNHANAATPDSYPDCRSLPIQIAALQQTGFTGAHNIFNGRFGFFELYQPNGHDASLLLQDLSTVFRGEALSYKPYPCGRPLHPAIDAALQARAVLEIASLDDIGSVTIEADPRGHSDQFSGAPTKRRPTQVVEAQFAQPFLIATALVHGKVGIAAVDGLGDASVLALSDRIAGLARDGRSKGSLSITVQRTGGRLVTV